ncbi:hypothetical protein LTR56_015111 [Elasticomyces elasticus]|nr:hypothetical protein LTR56_015111 [Elasticomyces elasticus]KAK3651954.1 hypothetical protein LTR22_011884 [Elasticomyces elasticus]KAK4919094.1 hypothetical protein LTR49_013265 [Elasticomyces elasticus]
MFHQGQISVEQHDRQQQLHSDEFVVQTAKSEEARAQDALFAVQESLRKAYEVQTQVNQQAGQLAAMSFQAGDLGLPAVAIVGGLTAAASVAWQQKQVDAAQNAVEEKREASRKAEKQCALLIADMKVLQSEKASLDDIYKVLQAALSRLMLIQNRVRNLLAFFTNVSDYVHMLALRSVDDHGHDTFLTQVRLPSEMSLSERDAGLDFEVHVTAVDIKTRFLIMNRIAQTYSQASSKYIMPGFNVVGEMTLSQTFLSDGQVGERSDRLTAYSQDATHKIREAVLETQLELQTGVERFTQECWTDVMGRMKTIGQ